MTESPTPPHRPPHGPTSRRSAALIGAGIALVLVLIIWLSFRWGAADSSATTTDPTTAYATETSAQELTTADIFATLAPSVVTIEAVIEDVPGTDLPHSDAPTTSAGAPETSTASRTTQSPPIVTASTGSAGTGVIVNGDGSIMTALHVVNNASAIRVTFADGTTSAATVASADAATDIAILTPETLPTVVVPAVLGGGLAVGDDVIAIGNQLGLTDSATTGVVSGLDRAGTNEDGTNLSGLIQFDAAVNRGSSGGPLVNAKGETVGIVVALVNPTDAATFIGIGFAVPIGTALGAAGGGRAPQK